MPCKAVLYVEASDESMKKRLLHRGLSSGRVDDNEETIKQRLQTFHNVTTPVIDYYQKQNKLKKVSAENSPDQVFEDVQKVFDQFESCKLILLRIVPLISENVFFFINITISEILFCDIK